MAQPRRWTDADRRAFARVVRDEPHRLSEIAGRAGVEPETVKDWKRRFLGDTDGTQNVPTLRLPAVPPVSRPSSSGQPGVSPTTTRAASKDARDALGKSMKKWFKSKRKRRKAAEELKTIIAEWERSQGPDTGEDYDRSRIAGGQATTRQTPRPTEVGKQNPARSSRKYGAFVLDAGLLAALVNDDYYAWKLLERSADGLHILIVPHDLAIRCRQDAQINKHVKRVLASKYVKKVQLNPEQMTAARSLCSQVDETFNMLDGVAVMTARVYVRMLSRRRFRKRFAPHLVTRDLQTMTKLIRLAGIRVVHRQPYHNTWSLLRLSLDQASRQRT